MEAASLWILGKRRAARASACPREWPRASDPTSTSVSSCPSPGTRSSTWRASCVRDRCRACACAAVVDRDGGMGDSRCRHDDRGFRARCAVAGPRARRCRELGRCDRTCAARQAQSGADRRDRARASRGGAREHGPGDRTSPRRAGLDRDGCAATRDPRHAGQRGARSVARAGRGVRRRGCAASRSRACGGKIASTPAADRITA